MLYDPNPHPNPNPNPNPHPHPHPHPYSNQSAAKPNRWKALLHSVKLEQTKVAGVEYSLQKLDQLRARLRLILAQHLIASKFYMRR